MKASYIGLLLCAAIAFTSCDNDTDSLLDKPTSGNVEGNVPEGYFRATFFPQPAGLAANTRGTVIGNSEQIQSLVCLIYQKQADGTYKYHTEKTVLKYEGTVGNIKPQTYEWPLKQEINFELPNGDYKAVFVGNADKNLFIDQKDNEILTGYNGDFASARINMPELGPKGFNQYNMFYLCTVDFSPANPSPNVLMQRVIAGNVYGRDMIDDNKAVSMLVDNLVKQIRENNLTTDVVKGLLRSALLDALSKATGLDVIAGSLTMALATGVQRILSGNHFITDVLAGAAIGSFTGFLVPFLHTLPKSKNLDVAVAPSGVLFKYRF